MNLAHMDKTVLQELSGTFRNILGLHHCDARIHTDFDLQIYITPLLQSLQIFHTDYTMYALYRFNETCSLLGRKLLKLLAIHRSCYKRIAFADNKTSGQQGCNGVHVQQRMQVERPSGHGQ
ncbi:hypothetical protein D3C73_1397820 [compost metagenome]